MIKNINFSGGLKTVEPGKSLFLKNCFESPRYKIFLTVFVCFWVLNIFKNRSFSGVSKTNEPAKSLFLKNCFESPRYKTFLAVFGPFRVLKVSR